MNAMQCNGCNAFVCWNKLETENGEQIKETG